MSETRPSIRIATRSSNLALWQAHHVADAIRRRNADLEVELVEVSTTGDRDQTGSLPEFGGVGVFTREVQRAVLDHRADLAVHSLKDLPTQTVPGLTLAAVPPRANPFDAIVLPTGHQAISSLDELPPKARIGTGSPRRQAQLLVMRPDLEILPIRGNVETRLAKLDDGQFDAILLAVAGLERLERSDRISLILKPPALLPAAAQGALGIECRDDDRRVREILRDLDDPVTRSAVVAERQVLATLQAGCHAPVGAFGEVPESSRLQLQAVVLSATGDQRIAASHDGDPQAAQQVGEALAQRLLADGAGPLVSG